MKLKQWIYRKRAEYYAKKLLPELKENEKVLDYGAGSGYLAELLSKKVNITLIDICDYNWSSMPLTLYDGKTLPYKNNEFDVGIAIAVLHHTVNPTEAIRELKRVCKRVIIIEEVYSSIFSRIHMDIWESFWSWTTGIDVYFNFHSNQEWRGIFKDLNLELASNHNFRSSLKNLEMSMFTIK